MPSSQETFKDLSPNYGSPRKIGLILRLLSICALILALTVMMPRQGLGQERLEKFKKFVTEIKKYVGNLAAGEVGEKELLMYLTANVKSDPEVQDRCQEAVNERNATILIEKSTLLFAGYLISMSAGDLFKIVKDKLELDGYTFVEQTKSWWVTSIRFFSEAPEKPRKKSFLLLIDQGWYNWGLDYMQGIKTNGSFCLVKIEKV